MASLETDKQLEFMIQAIATVAEYKPDWKALSEATGINTPQNARLRFKSIVEGSKKFTMQLEGGLVKVTSTGERAENETKTPGTPVAATPKTPKSRKRTKKSAEDGDGEGDVQASPTKKTKATPRAKKTAVKNKDKVEEEKDDEAIKPTAEQVADENAGESTEDKST